MSSRTARLLLIAVFVLLPSLAFAQGGQFSNILSSAEPLPNCNPAGPSQRQPIIWDATAAQVKTCTGPNIWSSISGGGGGGTPGSPLFSVQVNSGGTFGGIALGNSGAPLLSGGAGAFAAFGPLNLAGGSTVITGILPVANMPGTTVNSVVNDTNVTGSISGQVLTLGWTGTLAKTRTLATTVYTDQAQTYSAGPQTFPGGDFFAGGVNNQTGTSYTFVAGDINKLVTFNNGSATAVTLPRATTAGFTSGAILTVFNLGAGAVTITPTTSTFNGNATVVLNQNQGAFVESDGTNYEGWVSAAPTGSGTVTSVAFTVNSTSPSGIFTVTGSPITTSGTLNVNLAGTSGGVPYFSSGTVLSSSAALTANGVVLGGGAGSAPTVTVADTTVTHVLHTTNPVSFGAIVNADVTAVTWAAFASGTAISTATFPGGDLFMGGVDEQTGTTYTMVAADENKMLTLANAAAVAVTLPQATTAGFGSGALFYVFNEGPSTATITPTTSTINDAATLTLTSGTGATIVSDGTNYSALVGGAASFVNPMTTLGDIIYENSTPAAARLAGPTSPNGIAQSLCSTPAAGLAAAPQWCIPGVAIDAQTGTSFNIPITDDVTFITGNNGSATAWTGFTLANNYTFAFENLGAGLITYTPASGTVNGNATQIIPQNWFGFHYTNNTSTFMPVVPTIQAWPNCANVIQFTSSTGKISCSALALSSLATEAADTVVMNATGSTAAPTAVAMPTSGTNGCAGTSNALTYNTTTHALGCNTISGTGTVTTTGSPASPQLACFSGATSITNCANFQQPSANLMDATAQGTALTYAGGQDASANAAMGGATLRGGNETGAGGASSQGGPGLLAGGSNAATNTASVGGGVEVQAGPSTGASSTGLQGLALYVGSYAQSGTVTQWNLECFTSTAKTVTDCSASPQNIAGIALSKTSTVQVSVAGVGSEIAINASAAVTLGDTVCAGSTAGKVTDSGGTGQCSSGITVGTVVATSGTWPAYPDGTTFPTLSTTLPLIRVTGLQAAVAPNYYTLPGSASTGTVVAPVANQLSILGIPGVPAITNINHLTFNVQTADGTNNSAVCIYNSDGTLAAHTAPAVYASTGVQTVATVETNGVVKPGRVYFGFTSVSNVIRFSAIQNFPMGVFGAASFATTSGGACPASITPPADAWGYQVSPIIVGFAP